MTKQATVVSRAKKLAEYAKTLDAKLFYAGENPAYKSMGEVIIDGILQQGMAYSNVEKRVVQFRQNYPGNKTVSQFIQVVEKDGCGVVCGWSGYKLDYIKSLAEFLRAQKVETVAKLREWVGNKDNLKLLRAVPGVGPKTRDYLIQMAGVPQVAVDVHLKNFLQKAGVVFSNYEEAKKIIVQAGDILGMNPSQIDNAIWWYMKKKK